MLPGYLVLFHPITSMVMAVRCSVSDFRILYAGALCTRFVNNDVDQTANLQAMLSWHIVPHLEHFIATVPVQAVSLSKSRWPQVWQRLTTTKVTCLGFGFDCWELEFIRFLHVDIDKCVGIFEVADAQHP